MLVLQIIIYEGEKNGLHLYKSQKEFSKNMKFIPGVSISPTLTQSRNSA